MNKKIEVKSVVHFLWEYSLLTIYYTVMCWEIFRNNSGSSLTSTFFLFNLVWKISRSHVWVLEKYGSFLKRCCILIVSKGLLPYPNMPRITRKNRLFSFRPIQALRRSYMVFNLTKTKWYWGYSHKLPLLFQAIQELLYCRKKILPMKKRKLYYFFFRIFMSDIMGGFHCDLISYMKTNSSF